MSLKDKDFIFKESQKLINYLFLFYSINQKEQCIIQMSDDDEISNNQINKFMKILKHQSECENIINENLINWKFDRLESYEKSLLVYSTYMLIYDHLPKDLIIEFSVLNAKKYCQKNTYKMINGVLNNVIK